MKDVAGMLAEKYGATADEIVAAGAMKLYLQSMEPAEALRKVRAMAGRQNWGIRSGIPALLQVSLLMNAIVGMYWQGRPSHRIS